MHMTDYGHVSGQARFTNDRAWTVIVDQMANKHEYMTLGEILEWLGISNNSTTIIINHNHVNRGDNNTAKKCIEIHIVC